MPRKNACSKKAKAQKASGKQVFDSAFIEDPFEKLLDPDYEPSDTSDNEQPGLADEEFDTHYAFLMGDDGSESQSNISWMLAVNQFGSTMKELEHDGDDKDEHEDYEAEEAAKASKRLRSLSQPTVRFLQCY